MWNACLNSMWLRPRLWVLGFLLSIGLLSLGTATFCFAQESTLHFEHLTSADGLSNRQVMAILQDHQGFMWFGTQDGLNRYDGSRFTTYQSSVSDDTTLSDDFIYTLAEDSQNQLWIGTRNGGLNRLDLGTEQIQAFLHIPGDPTSLSHNEVLAIHPDSSGSVWVGTRNGLNLLDRSTGRFTRYRHNPDDPTSISHNTVYAISRDQHGVLWIGTEAGLDRLDPETNHFVRYWPRPVDSIRGVLEAVLSIYEDHAGILWIGSRTKGLLRLDPATKRFTIQPDGPQSLAHHAVSSIVEDQDGTLWVGTGGSVITADPNGKGIARLDPETGRITSYAHRISNPNSLSSNDVYAVYVSRENILWVATWGGVDKYVPGKVFFQQHMPQLGIPNTLSHNLIVPIYEDREGVLWVGTRGGGLNRIDRRTGIIHHYKHDSTQPNSISHDHIFALAQTPDRALWIGTFGGGLNRLDPATGHFKHFRHDSTRANSLSDDQVLSVYADRHGILWIGTKTGGLNRLDPSTNIFTHYRHDPANLQSIGSDYVWPLFESKDGTLWVGTHGGGLNQFEPDKGVFKRYQHDPTHPSSISSNNIFVIIEDNAGMLWIGTQGGGLNRFDPRTERFQAYTEADGLPNNNVIGLIEDERGDIWASMYEGLVRFDRQKGVFRTFDTRDGLQSTAFSVGSYFKNQQGEVFIGGTNGFNSFFPARVRVNPYPPSTVLTAFRLIGLSARSGRAPSLSRPLAPKIELRHWQNDVAIDYVALHYSNPAKNKYLFKLDNYDEDWREADASETTVIYRNLNPGSYVFYLKAANSDGVWNETPTSVAITIHPPFWLTWWFRCLIGLLISSLLYVAYRSRVRKLLEVERLRMRIAGNLHDDIGANLSTIMLKSEMVVNREHLDEVQQRQLSEINRLARDTATALREMVWVVNTGYDSIDKLISKLEDVTATLLDSHLSYHFNRPVQIAPRKIGMGFRQNVYFLYKEALHNAVKHAQATHLEIDVSLQQNMLRLQIQDDGIGFVEDAVKHGHGLSLMRKRAADSGGRLSIISRPGEGTRVVLETKIT